MIIHHIDRTCRSCWHTASYHYSGRGRQRRLNTTRREPACSAPGCPCERYVPSIPPKPRANRSKING